MCLYLVVFGMGLLILASDKYENLTNYTQANYWWKQRNWLDFKWHSGTECPEGYRHIIDYWYGTKPGNYTDDKKGVEVVVYNSSSDDWKPDIPREKGVRQYKIF